MHQSLTYTGVAAFTCGTRTQRTAMSESGWSEAGDRRIGVERGSLGLISRGMSSYESLTKFLKITITSYT